MISQKQQNNPIFTGTTTPSGIIILDKNKYFFTQLSLISQYLYRYLKQCLQIDGIHMNKYKINEQGDISTLCISYQYYKRQQKQSRDKQKQMQKQKQDNIMKEQKKEQNQKNGKNQIYTKDDTNNTNNSQKMQDCTQQPSKNIYTNTNTNKNKQQKLYRYKYQITLIQIQQIIKFHIIYKQQQFTIKINISNDDIGKIISKNQRRQNKTQVDKIREQRLKQLGLHVEQNVDINVNINVNDKENNKNRQIKEQDIIDRQQYSYIDQFWIRYKNYLPKKVYNSYQIQDLDWQNNKKRKQLFTHILKQRIAKPIYYQISQLISRYGYGYGDGDGQNKNNSKNLISPFKQKKSINQLMMTVLASNYNRIFKYLRIKQYKNLQMVSKQIYKVLHTQKNYKILFQQKWGRTGFDLDQKNWIKMLEKKAIESNKKNKQSFQGFRVNPDIWYV